MSETVVLAASASSMPSVQGRTVNDKSSQKLPALRSEGGNVAPFKPARNLDGSGRKSYCPETILRSFNTWSFKREQPSDTQLMLRVISDAIERNEPIPFLFYWGKGPRCHVDEHDIKCLEYLMSMAHRVSDAYEPGAALKLIFTNTHATLNGYSQLGINTYVSKVEAEAHRRGFESCRLADLIEQTQAKAEDDFLDDLMSDELLEKLFTSAVKWYHGEGTAEEGANKYLQMNMIEKRAVELAFPNAIFCTFNSSKFRILFPKRLPIFYMYSMQRGMAVKPWFLPADLSPCEPSNCLCRAAEGIR